MDIEEFMDSFFGCLFGSVSGLTVWAVSFTASGNNPSVAVLSGTLWGLVIYAAFRLRRQRIVRSALIPPRRNVSSVVEPLVPPSPPFPVRVVPPEYPVSPPIPVPVPEVMAASTADEVRKTYSEVTKWQRS